MMKGVAHILIAVTAAAGCAEREGRDKSMRKEAVDLATRTKDVAAIEALLQARFNSNNDARTRNLCFDAIIEIGDAAVPLLIDQLNDRNNHNRGDAAQLLYRIIQKHKSLDLTDIVPVLINSINDDEPLVASYCIDSLVVLQHKEAVRPLEKALSSCREAWRREMMAHALLEITDNRHAGASKVIDLLDNERRLITSAWAGDIKTVGELLGLGTDVNARYVRPDPRYLRAQRSAGPENCTALIAATRNGHTSIVVELLLTKKPDLTLSYRGRTALYIAVEDDRPAIVKLLIDAGAEENPARIRLTLELIRASCKGFQLKDGGRHPGYPWCPKGIQQAGAIDEMLTKGANINWSDPEGYTPLMYSANLGLIENVRILISRGADVHLKSQTGASALSLAVAAGHLEVVDCLKKAGTNNK